MNDTGCEVTRRRGGTRLQGMVEGNRGSKGGQGYREKKRERARREKIEERWRDYLCV